MEYQLTLADREKNLNVVPDIIDTPEKLKTYGTGRSALYIRPKQWLQVSIPSDNLEQGPSGILSTIMMDIFFFLRNYELTES